MTTSTHQPPTEQSTERRVVVGVDGSPGATRALEFAAHEAARQHAVLQVVGAYHVPATSMTWAVPLQPFAEAAQAAVRDGLARAEELEPGLVAKGDEVVGAAGPALVVASTGASLVVVGSRGHGELASIMLGSVATFVAHHAHCTTTIVR